jgi:2-hydroxy-6-oxonona-2,4-dienedioate hydrolase
MVPLAEVLACWFDVYAPDLPGFGRSEKPSRALDVPELADALARWLDTQRMEQAAFVVNSFGCQVVADLAVRHPRGSSGRC